MKFLIAGILFILGPMNQLTTARIFERKWKADIDTLELVQIVR